MRRLRLLAACLAMAVIGAAPLKTQLTLNDKEYFEAPGLNVIVFSDIYPDGHQTGVTVIQHGVRVAANGDLRLEASPGQWSPMPKAETRTVDQTAGRITQRLSYPDPSKNRTGFNPIEYPDLKFAYDVTVSPSEDGGFRIRVDLDRPLPAEWIGRVGFNLELFPEHLFGKSYLMGTQNGIFTRQPNGPVAEAYGGPLAEPLARGKTLIVAPESDLQRMKITSLTGSLELLDGRANHNNGWFIVRGTVPAGASKGAIEWIVTPSVVPGWRYDPVIQISQVGYLPSQEKIAIIETDGADARSADVALYRLTSEGRERVISGPARAWSGSFLRYRYLQYDFSEVTAPGMYVLSYAGRETHPFKIGPDVYNRHVWQPQLEYFLPNQMCHMLVREKYRVWHGLDHLDDARMAPVSLNHFDGYVQGPSTLTKFAPSERVPGLDRGGWHDAGDYDLRVESQMETVWTLAKLITEFGASHDATRIDQNERIVEIRQPDGRDDIEQQIEHGLLSVLGGYRSMGRLYRGIIEPTLEQYVLLGDISTQTDNVNFDPSNPKLKPDDRWVFTEDNPDRELHAVAGLAAASVALRKSNSPLAAEALAAAQDLFGKAFPRSKRVEPRVRALAELILATDDPRLIRQLVSLRKEIVANIEDAGWAVGPVMGRVKDPRFVRDVTAAARAAQAKVDAQAAETPYGVPYKPQIWGAAWGIQEFGVRQYFWRKGWPEFTSAKPIASALNFVLGAHPGENTVSFVSGVGARSATVAYGTNRADWSYIPGGVISGTNLVRPDLPELKVWPYFWQQTEYVMGGGSTHFMFLALAVDQLYGGENGLSVR